MTESDKETITNEETANVEDVATDAPVETNEISLLRLQVMLILRKAMKML